MNFKKAIKKIFFRHNVQPTLTVGTLNEDTRINWLKSVLKNIPEGSKILDAGAGEQPFKKFCNHLDYTSQDFAAYNPKESSSGLQMNEWDYGKLDIISDIAKIPIEDQYFDAIMCTEVFEHIINPREALQEFSRLLKKDGYLIITAPFCSLTHFAPYHFYSGFNKYFYEEELVSKGFYAIEIESNGNYFEYLAQEITRLEHIAQQYCKVALNQNEKNSVFETKKILQKLTEKDNNSSELLCFGYHIIARKK